MQPASEKVSVVLTILEDVHVDVVLIDISPSRISLATENQFAESAISTNQFARHNHQRLLSRLLERGAERRKDGW
jgi:hypothetical protein